MSTFQQRLAQLEERYQAGVAEFRKASREFEQTLAAVRQKYPPMTQKQREDLAEHYRSGAAGERMREIQAKVDRGEVTWDEIESGSADPELTRDYYQSFEEGGRLLRAAANGEPIENYLDQYPDEEDTASQQPQQPRRAPVDEDEHFRNQRFLGGDQDG